MSEVLDRFLKYVRIPTASREKAASVPSSPGQFDLARLLVDELKALGLMDAFCDDHCTVVATLPSNLPPGQAGMVPILMLNAHLDTSMEEKGEGVNPQVVKDYKGGEITLLNGLTISPEDTPALLRLEGRDIVTTDGNTLLGADDKAGIAEIMAALSHLVRNPALPHGTLKIVFTPDEEIGMGPTVFNASATGADFGYTVDGEGLNLGIETFNAVGGTVTIKGFNCHPGYAYDKMVNSLRALPDVLELFDPGQAPETTREYQGYLHPYVVDATVRETRVDFLLRDFDRKRLEEKMRYMEAGVAAVRKRHPRCEVALNLVESYKNMKAVVDQHPAIIKAAEEALREAGIQYQIIPMRGGTDGGRFCFQGVPTPNLPCGVYNAHSRKELVSVQDMESITKAILNVVFGFTKVRKG